MRFPTFPSGGWSLSLQWVITQTTQDHLPISLSQLCKPPFVWFPPCSFLVPSHLVGLWLLPGPRSMFHWGLPIAIILWVLLLENKPSLIISKVPSVSCWNLFRFSNLITTISAKTPRFSCSGLPWLIFFTTLLVHLCYLRPITQSNGNKNKQMGTN